MEIVNILINDILKKWNPLEVPSEIAEDEYSSYVTLIMKHTQDINSIYLCLKTILTDYMDMEIIDSVMELSSVKSVGGYNHIS